jgi:hypothetical protein
LHRPSRLWYGSPMHIDELLRTLNDADIYVMVNGRLGFITNATRVCNDWFLFVADDDTRAKVGEIKVPMDGTVEVVRVVR